MRKLATIRQISRIDPIPDADAIEVATIDGWKVVVKKERSQEGGIFNNRRAFMNIVGGAVFGKRPHQQ